MITRIEVKNFKSLKHVELKLGWFNLFIGENASGKSNFLEVLRVLQGIGNGFTVGEILDGKSESATSEKWDGIRGGSRGALFRPGNSHTGPERISLNLDFGIEGELHYGIVLGTERVAEEVCTLRGDLEFKVTPHSSNPDVNIVSDAREEVGPTDASRPLIGSEKFDAAYELSDCQKLEFSLETLRDYSTGSGKRIGERGEHIYSLLNAVFADPRLKAAYLSWVTKLPPTEIDDINIREGLKRDFLMEVTEGSRRFTADLLSDGTLRFAALVAAFFQPEMPKTILLEEIETGLHPTRIKLLLQLLKERSKETGAQVFATTHSPAVLSWLDESDYDTTFVCTRDEESQSSIIRPLSQLPRLPELAKKYTLGQLFAEGWMESVP